MYKMLNKLEEKVIGKYGFEHIATKIVFRISDKVKGL